MNLQLIQAASHRVLIVGAGGNGSNLFDKLLMYIQEKKLNTVIDIIDADAVTESNLSRQKFSFLDVGKPKVYALRDRAIRRGYTRVVPIKEYLQDSTLSLRLSRLDYNRHSSRDHVIFHIFVCVDNLESRNHVWSKLIHQDGSPTRLLATYENISVFIYDLGNTDTQGQVVIGGVINTDQYNDGDMATFGVDIRNLYPDMDSMREATDSPERTQGNENRGSCTNAPEIIPQTFFANDITSGIALSRFIAIMEGQPVDALTEWVSKPSLKMDSSLPIELKDN